MEQEIVVVLQIEVQALKVIAQLMEADMILDQE
jgi:hypothetical protein